MAGRGRRDAEAAVRIGRGNVFAALEVLRKKKKKKPSPSYYPSSASGRKGGQQGRRGWGECGRLQIVVSENVLILGLHSGVMLLEVVKLGKERFAYLESESEDDGLDVDMGEDEPEEEPEHETEVDLSKKELKKELAELAAVLAELGISGDATQADATSKPERKPDEQNDGDKIGAPSEIKSSKKKKSKKGKSLKDPITVDVKEKIKKIAAAKKKKRRTQMWMWLQWRLLLLC
ncbi:hypothetical protein GUJ93_ZPchr0006g42489 [Zizania palustris]|uniref:Uncharacterized protein n=1 Tax=Zizania palustris TaxID=103762 RepID=A0A8J5SE65_ZIZPA|nr:hypothetical protein GUJ93_ZPchr0006g42489 [Zizania palustris]